MSAPIAKAHPYGREDRNPHAREKPDSPSAVRMRRMRERQARGVVYVASLEILRSDIPMLIRAGHLRPDGTCLPEALNGAIKALIEAWIDERTTGRL